MKMKKSYPVFLIGISLMLGSCANMYVKQGDKKFDRLAYADAVQKYEKAIAKKDIPSIQAKLGDAYRMTNNPVKAEAAYKRALDTPDPDPILNYHYGRVLMENKKSPEAQSALEAYLKSNPEAKYVQALIDAAKNPNQFKDDTVQYTLNKVELSGLVSAFGATPYNFGYIFTGESVAQGKGIKKRDPSTGSSYFDLYYTKKEKSSGKWAAPAPLSGDVNSTFHDAFATVSADGKSMYFTRTNQQKGKIKLNQDNEATLNIVKLSLVDGDWVNPEFFPFNNDDYSVGHPSLSKDGSMLFFSSNKPGGIGETDIYMSSWNGSSWSEPTNLGSAINTPGKELFPMAGGKDTLYFSSNTHPGLGGFDVFRTVYTNGQWSQPENVGYPINSSRDDFSFSMDDEGKLGLITSSRSGVDQLYEVVYNGPRLIVEGIVKEKGTNNPYKGANAILLNKTTGDEESIAVDGQGRYSFIIKPGFEYAVNAASDDKQSLSNSVDVSTKGKKRSETFNVDLELEKFEKGKGIEVKDIFYDYDKADIRPDAMPSLDQLVKLLIDNPQYKVEMGSHTDCRGSDSYNQNLSERRAKSVVKYCTLRGIDSRRLTFKGYGESEPRVNCEPCESCSEEQHQQNRRTEFKVIDAQ
jgi:outer membrane protein OmpA-like peptidoglycan-associated protein